MSWSIVRYTLDELFRLRETYWHVMVVVRASVCQMSWPMYAAQNICVAVTLAIG